MRSIECLSTLQRGTGGAGGAEDTGDGGKERGEGTRKLTLRFLLSLVIRCVPRVVLLHTDEAVLEY